MQTFPIVKQTGGGRRRINGRPHVDTIQAIVNFGTDEVPELVTRHLEQQPMLDEKGKVVGHHWTGWNSDSVLARRAEILESRRRYEESVQEDEALIGKLRSELTELKGKRGAEATAERKRLREWLKGNEAALAIIKSGRDNAVAIAKRVDETHPEIMVFE